MEPGDNTKLNGKPPLGKPFSVLLQWQRQRRHEQRLALKHDKVRVLLVEDQLDPSVIHDFLRYARLTGGCINADDDDEEDEPGAPSANDIICSHFSLSLIQAFMRASPDNYAKLKSAFPDHATVHSVYMHDQADFVQRYG
jgi:hypothetical protein